VRAERGTIWGDIRGTNSWAFFGPADQSIEEEETIMTIRKARMTDVPIPRSLIFFLFLGVLLTGCSAIYTMDFGTSTMTPTALPAESTFSSACPVSEPVWAKPPDDPAVTGSPEHGYYFVNEDRSIWASAWWTEEEEHDLRVSEEGIKVGWFRPAGATLEITGQRLDAQAPSLEAHVPCCYPTRFQATGLYFPTEGCWEVTAKAADSVLAFVVRVQP